jgi:predicted MFS family arabinose efflux permease
MNARALALAVAGGLALADASLVTLALPNILHDLNTTIEGVAAVIGLYTLVIAVALLPFERAASRFSVRVVGASGFAVLAMSSVVCAAAGSLPVLLVARGAQALGGAAGLSTVFGLLGGARGRGRSLWVWAAVFATAAGPAIGGALTQAFSWRAIFVFQVPIALAGAVAVLAGPRRAPLAPAEAERDDRNEHFAWRPAVALGLVSAALSAVLFLLVLLLVAGWNVSPLGAAGAVTIIPVFALIGARIGGDQQTRAVAGCALVGGGVLALAWLPTASLWWTVAPQLLAGVGMGLALTAMGGGLLPERTPRDAARLLTIRYAGIAAILAIAAPIAAHQLKTATLTAREQGVALVLDASLPPLDKIKLAPALLDGVQSNEPRAGLRRAVAKQRDQFSGADLVAYNTLGRRADQTLIAAVGKAFRSSFVIAGAAGFLAALLLLAGVRVAVLVTAGALAVGVPVAYAALYRAVAPEPPTIQDPCNAHRTPPDAGGITGFLQRQALGLLDVTACRLGSSREELVLALADKEDARRFKREHGVDPRTAAGALQGLLGGG